MASDWEIDIDGVDQNFNDNLDFLVTTSYGTGMPQIDNLISPMAQQVGGILNGQNLKSRTFRLRGSIVAEAGENKVSVHTKRQALIKAVSSYTTDIAAPPPTRQLTYTGATVNKVINAVFDGGLEDEPPTGWSAIDMDLRFVAPDPLFYATSETTAALDSNDEIEVNLWTGLVSGQWSNMDDPTGGLANESIEAIVSDDTYIYLGGNFINFDGNASADYIVRYNRSTGAYSALGSGLNNTVYDMVVDANGDLIVVGSFTNAGGVGAADRIAKWDGASWSAIGTPAITNPVYAVAIAPNGDIYFGGVFTNLGSVANADYVGYWDVSASAYKAISTGVDSNVNGIAISAQDNIILTGNFDNAGGSAAAKIVKWDGSAFSTLSSGLNADGHAVIFGDDGTLYVGGDFTTAGGASINRIASWNGVTFSALGDGAGADVRALSFTDSGKLVAGGDFVSIGGVTTPLATGLWNGSTWERVMLSPQDAGSLVAYAVHTIGNDIYLGLFSSTASTRTVATHGAAAVSYAGTAIGYGYLEISRSGGTSATLYGASNAETGARLLFDYDLQDGETVTIELRPQEGVSFTSSLFGVVNSAILPTSDTGQFFLMPSNASGSNSNSVLCFVDGAGSPTITANLKYTAAYLSLD